MAGAASKMKVAFGGRGISQSAGDITAANTQLLPVGDLADGISKMSVDLVIDFHGDLTNILKTELTRAGFSIGNMSGDDLTLAYLNAVFRLIEPRNRSVKKSSELACPGECVVGLELIQEKSERGDSLRPHQSRQIDDPFYKDTLLSDWGIHHLHLGTTLERNGFIKRTRPVLFARVTNDCLYMIQIMDHGPSTGDVWSRQELVEIIHRNWPDSIRQFRIRGIQLEWKASDSEIKQLRGAGILTMLEMEDGTIYLPVGGGIASDRTSVRVGLAQDQYYQNVRAFEEYFKSNGDLLARQAEQAGRPMRPPFQF